MADNRDKVKEALDSLEAEDHLEIVSLVNVWSNGKLIRRYAGQGEHSSWHNPKNGFRKMVAILVEVEEDEGK